ncbi:MAG: hypothetical protein JWO85_2865 [Candidatus Eremiobacteraeota bacterium]|nr:hypothetical protein [Candidatus Eremiobacteraeota bacterium]
MRRFSTSLFVVLIALVGLIVGVKLFWNAESQRYQAVDSVRHQRSEIRLSEVVTHAKGPIAREQLRMTNLDGKSTVYYEAQNRSGSRVARFTYPINGYDVTFAFDVLVRDGIWELQNKPLRGTNTDNVYTISIAQTAGDRSGSHTFTFTDPHYLANAREYAIHLDKNKPVPDLLTLKSTTIAEPRYQKIVDDFGTFGPVGFRKTVGAAREKLLRS